ncbi:MAG: tetratricopeptide repeat protein [Thermoguttaceae bacterium]|jgi:putative thioredoxin|nr:tetratricopeptide repeat protein [Thermoguttaceae bacterium]
MAPSPWIVETSSEKFQEDVLERSKTVPVVVDFWASWCAPCRALAPILERLADEHQGRFVLVKANTEQMPELAAAFGVEVVPTVFALRNGAVVNHFQGLLSEAQVRQWLQQVLPSEAEVLTAQARKLERTDPSAAEAAYRKALELSPNEIAARIGLARTVLAHGRIDEARQIIDELADLGALDAEGERLQAEIVLHTQALQAGGVESARAAAAADPENLALQLQLARALAAAGQHEEAMEICLQIVHRDRRGAGEQARELMVFLFHLLGPDSELTSTYRRKLALALY